MEVPNEIWCEILRYLELEQLEEEVYADKVDNERKQRQLERISEALHYTVWCLRGVMERISDSQYQLELSLACLHRGEALLQPTLRPYGFDKALEQIQTSVKKLSEIEMMYGNSVREMGQAVDLMRHEVEGGNDADDLPPGYVNL